MILMYIVGHKPNEVQLIRDLVDDSIYSIEVDINTICVTAPNEYRAEDFIDKFFAFKIEQALKGRNYQIKVDNTGEDWLYVEKCINEYYNLYHDQIISSLLETIKELSSGMNGLMKMIYKSNDIKLQ